MVPIYTRNDDRDEYYDDNDEGVYFSPQYQSSSRERESPKSYRGDDFRENKIPATNSVSTRIDTTIDDNEASID